MQGQGLLLPRFVLRPQHQRDQMSYLEQRKPLNNHSTCLLQAFNVLCRTLPLTSMPRRSRLFKACQILAKDNST
eukprot:8766246-Karenia_brevis.AAC.1